MRPDRLVKRLVGLGWNRRLMLAEALVAVAAASIAIRVLPFERAVRLGSRRLARSERTNSADICREARWGVRAVAPRVPWRAVCFQQGLALQWMLRRRGIDARLHYGVGKSETGDLGAHVWISAGKEIVIGGEDAPRFRAVAVYP